MYVYSVTCNSGSAITGSAPRAPGEEMLVNMSIVRLWKDIQRLPGLDDDMQALRMLPNCDFPRSVFNLRDLRFNF